MRNKLIKYYRDYFGEYGFDDRVILARVITFFVLIGVVLVLGVLVYADVLKRIF